MKFYYESFLQHVGLHFDNSRSGFRSIFELVDAQLLEA